MRLLIVIFNIILHKDSLCNVVIYKMSMSIFKKIEEKTTIYLQFSHFGIIYSQTEWYGGAYDTGREAEKSLP